MTRSLPHFALMLGLVAGVLTGCDEAEPSELPSEEQDAGPDSDAEVPPPCEEPREYSYIGVSEALVCPNLLVCNASDVVGECPDVYRCDIFVHFGNNQSFIHRDLVCDGNVDCPQADDEIGCPGTERTRCEANDSGIKTFYTPEQRCDAHAECFWGDDEKDCEESLVCPHPSGPGIEVVARSKVCDGKWDCLIDEFDCPGVVDPFTCDRGRTIDRRFVCDGIPDCYDASDELDPSCQQIQCRRSVDLHSACAVCNDETSEGTRCAPCTPAFLPKSKVCDGKVDCTTRTWICETGTCEETDESNCP